MIQNIAGAAAAAAIALDRNCTKSGSVLTEIQFFIFNRN
jgi:hypothetical protein